MYHQILPLRTKLEQEYLVQNENRNSTFFSVTYTSVLTSATLGSINLRVAGFTFAHDMKNAIFFFLAVVITQIIIARLAFAVTGKVNVTSKLNNLFGVMAAIMMILFAARFLAQACEKILFLPNAPTDNLIVFFYGLFYSLVSPMSLSSLALVQMIKCKYDGYPANNSLSNHLTAIALGIVLSFFGYAVAGYYLAEYHFQYLRFLKIIIGLSLLLLASKRVFKILTSALSEIEKQLFHTNSHKSNTAIKP